MPGLVPCLECKAMIPPHAMRGTKCPDCSGKELAAAVFGRDIPGTTQVSPGVYLVDEDLSIFSKRGMSPEEAAAMYKRHVFPELVAERDALKARVRVLTEALQIVANNEGSNFYQRQKESHSCRTYYNEKPWDDPEDNYAHWCSYCVATEALAGTLPCKVKDTKESR